MFNSVAAALVCQAACKHVPGRKGAKKLNMDDGKQPNEITRQTNTLAVVKIRRRRRVSASTPLKVNYSRMLTPLS